jgi:spore maturation protein CgeB
MLRSRSLLLGNPLVYRANAYLKAAATRRALARLSDQYTASARDNGRAADERTVIRWVRERLKDRDVRRPGGARLRIFWVGSNFPQDDSGFLQALRTFGEVQTFQNAEGGYGLLFHGKTGQVKTYDARLVERNDQELLKQVGRAVETGGCDLLMGQMWANYLSAAALRRVQQMGIPTVNVAMDDRLSIHWESRKGVRLGSVGLASGLDLVLTTSPECCLWYAVEDCPALFWPLASDPGRFAPAPEDAKRYDVTFVGNRYGLRGEIVDALIAAGVSVEAFGAGWSNGPVDANQASEIFALSRIILGVGTIGHNTDLYTLKLRDFDATMAGALYVTHRNPDLLRLFEENREIVCYQSIQECVARVRHYLNRPEERIPIAAAGAARARREHTWRQRLEYVLDVLGIARPPRAQDGGS